MLYQSCFFLAVAEARPIPALHDDKVDRLERLYHKDFRLKAGVPVIRIRLAHGREKNQYLQSGQFEVFVRHRCWGRLDLSRRCYLGGLTRES